MTEQGQRTEFRDLLRQRRADLGLSLRDMEARCVDPGSGAQAKFGWLSKVENGKPVDAPKEELLRALEAGYRIPLDELRAAAAAQFFGLDAANASSGVWSDDRTLRIIVAHAGEMTEEDRQELAEIAEVMARRRAQRNGPGQGKSDD
ncbi:helix-turn-helix transcriptional regulator [Streptomyces parvulus]|uniref:helix-turn-helix transcriptional regulator n=1 Tax=Streptomyces parvulus TaxID=146923 RepID=UPI0033F6E165